MSADQEAVSLPANSDADAPRDLGKADRLLSAFRTLSETIVNHITNRYEPVDDLVELNGYLLNHTADVWELLHTPRLLIAAR
jgi:hypothetical protein